MHIGHHIHPQLLLAISDFLGNYIYISFILPSEQYGNNTTPKIQRKVICCQTACHRVNAGIMKPRSSPLRHKDIDGIR